MAKRKQRATVADKANLNMKYVPQLRIADGPWLMPAMGVFESKESAESFGKWAAKQWLGAAKSRAVPLDESLSESCEAPIIESDWDESQESLDVHLPTLRSITAGPTESLS